jgi:hypothetical protein
LKLLAATVLALSLCSLGGCATTLRGTTDVLVVESDPPGASVRVSNGLSGFTPVTFTLRRKGDYVVTITKEGYENVSVNVTHKVVGAGSAGMAGNLLLGGIIGAAVDAGSGAMFDLVPNPIKVNLLAIANAPARAAPANLPSSSSTPPAALSPPPAVRRFTADDAAAAAATISEMRLLSQALLRYARAHGALPPGKTITEIYPALARDEPVRVADHWGNLFAFGATSTGFVLASAGADGVFDDASWGETGDQTDLGADAVLRVEGNTERFIRRWVE